MRYPRTIGYALLLALSILPSIASTIVVQANLGPSYTLTPVPYSVQEGNSVDLVLSVTGATAGLQYEFLFHVRDPSSRIWNSSRQDVIPTTSSFTVLLTFPSSSVPGTSSLVGQYNTWVNQTMPLALSNAVASSHFFILLTDRSEYQRTQTVSIRGSGYNVGDSVTVTIVRQSTSTLVFSQSVLASSSGIVATTWKIPKNITLDNYVLSLTGTSTPAKSPADVESFGVSAAVISIAALSSLSSNYQRTETMMFSFQPAYPSGEIASTGAGVITLTRSGGTSITLTASTFDNVTQTFSASYKTFLDNQTGTWTASLRAYGYGDGYGNYGPSIPLTSSPQLQPATFTITITTSTYLAVGQPVRLNATIQYPDGTSLRSGQVFAFFSYAAGGHNDSVPIAFDTTLQLWVGSYTPQSNEPGGLWSLTVKAWDSPLATPPNSGLATRVITMQDRPSTFPLYYFGILAALIGAGIAMALLFFRRRKVTHARLKIDLEAVKTEAGRIEDQDFFRSVRDQLNKDKEQPG